MTDIEMAEEYAFTHYGDTDNDGNPLTDDIIMQRAFLAGIEAGRPKWHDVLKDPTDLPPRGTIGDDVLNVSIIVLDQDGNRCFYDYVNNNWINAEGDGDWYIKEDFDEYVYCWCEKPKCNVYKSEE